MSFFASVKTSFVTLPAEGEIPTALFLDACAEIVPLFGNRLFFDAHTTDALGSTAFAPVKSDINGNIKVLSVNMFTLCF